MINLLKQYIALIISFCIVSVSGLAIGQDSGSNMLRDLDIPLMAGLEENVEEALVFDSPDGRIISAIASGAVRGQEVFDYYKVVLPSLGWQVNKDHNSGLTCENASIYCISAIRDEELLLLNVSGMRAPSTISYSLSPN